jgi:hypothetical protein
MSSLFLALVAVLQDPTLPQQLQKRVQAETDQTVRRINTMLRALSFHRLDTAEENRVLEEMAVSLAGLSREQMTDVLHRLEAASKISDAVKSKAEVEEAYTRHREILVALGRLLSRYDAVRSLDQAAERLEKLAGDELDIHLQALQLSRVGAQMLAVEKAAEAERKALAQEPDEKVRLAKEKELNKRRDQRTLLRSGVHQMAERLSDDQFDLHRNVGEVMMQLAELKARLPQEQVERLEKVERLAQQRQLVPALDEASKKLRVKVEYSQRYAQWKASAFLEWKSSGDLREVARSLRAPVEDVETLRDARRRVEQAIERQTALRIEAGLPPESKDPERLERHGQELGDRQARAEFEARDTRVLLLPKRQALAERLLPAEEAMRAAQEALRDGGGAQKEQERATEALKAFLGDLDQAIAAAEKAEKDPLAALQKTKEDIEKLIQEQKEIKKETEEAKDKQDLPKTAPKQEKLAEKTEALRQEATPESQKIDPPLQKAEKAMEKAAEALQDQKQPEAAQKQEQALAALEEAKKAVDEAIADAQKQQNELLPSAAQQVAKAIEQAQAAQDAAEKAAQAQQNKPTLAEQQKNLAEQAKQSQQPAAEASQKAAEALAQGDAQAAVPQQEKALAQLEQAAAEAPQNSPQAQQAGEQAQQQKGLLEATKALAQAQAANAEAQAAAAQAQATAPPSAQAPLAQAQGELAQAQAQAQQGQPAESAQSDAKAVDALQQALDSLNAQLAELGLPQVTPGQPQAATTSAPKPGQPQAKGQGKEPGQGPPGQEPGQGEEPGQGPPGQAQAPGQGQSPTPGPSQEQNISKGSGNREPDGNGKNAGSQLKDVKSGDSFLHLPPRQRDLIRQSLNETMPGEYSSLIQQYYVNLARGRAATGPAVEERKK